MRLPFFTRNINQNVSYNGNKAILENFNGSVSEPIYREKKEIEKAFPDEMEKIIMLLVDYHQVQIEIHNVILYRLQKKIFDHFIKYVLRQD